MLLKALTNGAISGTGEVTVKSLKIGGILVTTDNSAQGTVILKRNDTNGKRIFDITTTTTIWVGAPFSTEETETVYFDVSGAGCQAQIYEWVD